MHMYNVVFVQMAVWDVVHLLTNKPFCSSVLIYLAMNVSEAETKAVRLYQNKITSSLAAFQSSGH